MATRDDAYNASKKGRRRTRKYLKSEKCKRTRHAAYLKRKKAKQKSKRK